MPAAWRIPWLIVSGILALYFLKTVASWLWSFVDITKWGIQCVPGQEVQTLIFGMLFFGIVFGSVFVRIYLYFTGVKWAWKGKKKIDRWLDE